MKNSLTIEGKEHISASRAAEITRYSKDYIGQLCRHGKVKATMMGRTWFVDKENLLAYKKESDERDAARRHEASENAKKIYHKDEKGYLHETLPEQKLEKLVYAVDERPLMPELKKAIFDGASKPDAIAKTTPILTPIKKVSIVETGPVKSVFAAKDSDEVAAAALANPRRVASSYKMNAADLFKSPGKLSVIAIAFLFIGFVALNSAVISDYGHVPFVAKISSLESFAKDKIDGTMRSLIFAVNRFANDSPLARNDGREVMVGDALSMNAAASDSIKSGWNSFKDWSRGKLRTWLGIRDYGASEFASQSTTTVALAVNPPPLVSTGASAIVQRIVERPQTTVINRIDPTLLARIASVENQLAEDRDHDRRQTYAIYDSVGRNISDSIAGISSGGSGTVTSVEVSGGTTGLSFSGGPVTTSGTLTLSGTLDLANGGTGIAIAPDYGELLMGDGSGGYALTSTTSLGINSGVWGAVTGTLSDQTDLQTALNAKLALTDWYATTTDGLAEGTTNKYYSNRLFSTDLSGTTTDALSEGLARLYFTNDRVASVIAGTTTDALDEGLTNRYYDDALVNAYIHASTTIPKLYSANIWTAGNEFANSTTTNATTTSMYISGRLTGANLSNCDSSTGKLVWNNGQFSCGVDAGSTSGLASLNAEFSSPQTGSSQTFATSTSVDDNIRLTITSNSNEHTFTPSWNGTLAVTRGGTGLSSVGASSTVLQSNGSSLVYQKLSPDLFNSQNVSQWTNDVNYLTSLSGAASSTLLADSNTFSGNNTFSNTITGSITGNAGTVTNGVYTTDTGTVTNTMLAGAIANDKLANSSLTVNGTAISLGGSGTITAASSTLLADSNTFTGSNTFSGVNSFTNASSNWGGTWQTYDPSYFQIAGSYLTSYDAWTHPSYGGQATSSLLTLTGGLLSTASTTINNEFHLPTLANGGLAVGNGLVYSFSTSTWTFASSTLLADSNTFSGNNTFSNPITGSITGNAGTVTNGVYTTDTGTVTNTMLAGAIANDKLANSSLTVNGTAISLGGSGTITAASSTLLANDNTWSGTNAFGTLTASSFNLGVGLAHMLAGFDASGNLTSTSSPQVAYINATSTTATSTFAGGLQAGGSSGLYVLQNGNVGIGTARPSGKLHLYGASGNALKIEHTTTVDDTYSEIDFKYNISNISYWIGKIVGTNRTSGGGSIDFYTTSSGASEPTTPRMSITRLGNVGIGTTTPVSLLQVVGATAPKITLSDTDASTQKHWFLESNSNNFNIGTTSDALATNSSYRAFTILNNGNVGMGIAEPTELLHVYSAVNNADLMLETSATGGVARIFLKQNGPRSNGLEFSKISFSGFDTLGSQEYANIGVFEDATTNGAEQGRIVFRTMASGVLTDVLTLKSDKVGIGTTSPYAKLSVTGSGLTTGVAFQVADSANSPKFTVLDNGTVTSVGAITVSAGTASTFPYASTTALSASGTLFVGASNETTILGTATSTFGAGVEAAYLNITGNSATSTFANGIDLAGGCFSINGECVGGGGGAALSGGTAGMLAAWTSDSALTATGTPTFDAFTATSTTATSTIAGGLAVGNNGLVYDFSTAITSIASFSTGNINFETDAGAVSWVDLDVSAAAAGTVESYTAHLDGSPAITVYGTTTGSGVMTATNPLVGIASTTPWRTLAVSGTAAISGLSSGAAGDYAVCINNATGELTNAGASGCIVSSSRFKDNIVALDSSIDELMLLKPSTFTLKGQDPEDIHMGFIAEDVAEVDKRLVQYEADGETPRTVRYEEMSALIVKAVQEQQGQIAVLSTTTANLVASTTALASTTESSINTVSANYAALSTDLTSSKQTVKTLSEAIDSVSAASSANFQTIDARVTALGAAVSTNRSNLAELSSTTLSLNEKLSELASTTTELASTTFALNASFADLASSTASTTAYMESQSFMERIAVAVKEMIESVGEWVVAKISATLAIFERVETQTAAVSNGLEMTDQATGEIYCVRIANGDFAKTKGACEASATVPVTPPDQTPPNELTDQIVLPQPPDASEFTASTTTATTATTTTVTTAGGESDADTGTNAATADTNADADSSDATDSTDANATNTTNPTDSTVVEPPTPALEPTPEPPVESTPPPIEPAPVVVETAPEI